MTAGAETCWAARGAVNLPPFLKGLDCHSKERDGGASALPTQSSQFASCLSEALPRN